MIEIVKNSIRNFINESPYLLQTKQEIIVKKKKKNEMKPNQSFYYFKK